MLPSLDVLVIVAALVVSVRTTPSNVTRGSDVYDPDSIPQNEKLLRLLLRLASHTASRLIHLKREAKQRAIVPAVRMDLADDELQPSVLDEALTPNNGRHGDRYQESHGSLEKSSKVVGVKDVKVAPVEVASRMLIDVDKNNNNVTENKNNTRNASKSRSSEVGSRTQGVKSVISNAGRSGIGNQAQNVTSGLQPSVKSAAEAVKSVISITGASGVADQALNATHGLQSLLPGVKNTTEGSGVKNAARRIESVISNAAKATTEINIMQPTKNTGLEIVERILKPDQLISNIPLFRSFPDAHDESSTTKKFATHSKDNSTKASDGQTSPNQATTNKRLISIAGDKTSNTSRDPKSRNTSSKNPAQNTHDKNPDQATKDKVSELDLKGFALQFADALRPVNSDVRGR